MCSEKPATFWMGSSRGSLARSLRRSEMQYPVGDIITRAQIGMLKQDVFEPSDGRKPFESQRMKPKTDAAKEGLVNPKGIPCLYVATDETTAISEVRPWRMGRSRLPR